MTPKVSVIIPVYNVEDYLPRCLDSLVNQTLKDIEIICVNDGSTDNSLAILQDYAAKDDRIKIIDKENSGPGDCRNRGIEAAKGEFIAFVDSDDWVELNTYEETYKKAQKEDVPLVCFNACIVDNKNKKAPRFYYETEKEFTGTWKDIQHLIFKTPFHSWHFLFKRDFLNENNIRYPALSLCEDVPFVLKALLCAKKISFIPDIFYNYFQRPTSIVSTISTNALQLLEVISLVKNVIKSTSEHDYDLSLSFFAWRINLLSTIGKSLKSNLKDYFLSELENVLHQREVQLIVNNINPLKDEYRKIFYLFGFIPLLVCSNKKHTLKIRLFKYFTLFKVKNNNFCKKYFIFNVLIMKVKKI